MEFSPRSPARRTHGAGRAKIRNDHIPPSSAATILARAAAGSSDPRPQCSGHVKRVKNGLSRRNSRFVNACGRQAPGSRFPIEHAGVRADGVGELLGELRPLPERLAMAENQSH